MAKEQISISTITKWLDVNNYQYKTSKLFNSEKIITSPSSLDLSMEDNIAFSNDIISNSQNLEDLVLTFS